jgi:hypothetical protein
MPVMLHLHFYFCRWLLGGAIATSVLVTSQGREDSRPYDCNGAWIGHWLLALTDLSFL